MLPKRQVGPRQTTSHSELLLAAVHACPHGLALQQSGKILVANAAYARLLGHASADAVVGKSAARLLNAARVAASKRNGHGGGPELESMRFEFRHAQRPVSLEILRDVSARRSLEQQLRESQKMEALGRAVGGVAHDFNNLLTAVMLYCDLLRRELPADGHGRRQADEISLAAQRGALLVRQMLAFARQQVLQPRVLSLNSIVLGMRNMLQRLMGEDVELVTRCGESSGNVRVDPGQIQQVILNLVVNARDALASGGKVIIQTAKVKIDVATARRHPGLHPGEWVQLAVADTGCGMDAETLAHACEPFFTTKEKGKGTGLGLPMVYGIVTQSGGTFSLDSHPGRGTRATILLPRVAQPARMRREPRRHDDVPAGCETVLLVEDDPGVRESATQLLRAAGYTVLQARDGYEALRVAGRHGGPIDLLICDMVLPGLNGPAVAKRLRTRQPGLRVLYTSGYGERARSFGITEPGTAILQKPFQQSALAHRVRQMLDRRAAAAAGRA